MKGEQKGKQVVLLQMALVRSRSVQSPWSQPDPSMGPVTGERPGSVHRVVRAVGWHHLGGHNTRKRGSTSSRA
jgi:hypothetical protein